MSIYRVIDKIEKERKLVLTTGSGFVTKEEVLTHQDQMLKDPDFDPSFAQLADFARLTNTDISMADLQTFAQKDVFSIHSRRAIIVKGDLAFGFAKIFELSRQLAGAHGILRPVGRCYVGGTGELIGSVFEAGCPRIERRPLFGRANANVDAPVDSFEIIGEAASGVT